MRKSKTHSSLSEMNDEWGNLEASWASLKARACIADHISIYIHENIYKIIDSAEAEAELSAEAELPGKE